MLYLLVWFPTRPVTPHLPALTSLMSRCTTSRAWQYSREATIWGQGEHRNLRCQVVKAWHEKLDKPQYAVRTKE